jgi:putative ABC transport system substrate-binding protein
MDRRTFIGSLALGTLAAPLAAKAQQAGKVWRIGVLELRSRALNANFDAFRQGLQEFGYVEGQNFVIEYRSADGRPERFPGLATEMVRLKVDLILTRGTSAALAAKNATRTIPIVMLASSDPVGTGVVASLARPGGNVTGLSGFTRELAAKRVQLLKEIVPRAARIAVLLNSGNLSSSWKEIQAAARSQGVRPELLDTGKSDDLEHAFDAIRLRVDALLVATTDVTPSRLFIPDLAAKHRLPAMYVSRAAVDAGGLISYGANYPDLYRRAAVFVDKIPQGRQAS